ncbi:uncharacterized protein [Rhodnius prolixus]|uniref:uncharacterized protein n=1 Tax=Rhodnius prolixus TaxID=13249 RepID=UPI003D18EA96
MQYLPSILLAAIIILSKQRAVQLQDPECPEDGYFPSFSSCHQYNICLNGFKTTYLCKNGIHNFVYSPKTRSCVKQHLRNKCFKILCFGQRFSYIAYWGDPSIYVLCYQYKPQMLLKCPTGMKFNNMAQTCLIACDKEGNKLDPEDCTRFYECVKAPEIYKYYVNRRICPENSWFNPDFSQCTGVDLKNCPKATPTTVQPTWIPTSEHLSTTTSSFTTSSDSTTPSPMASTTPIISSTTSPFTSHTPATAFTTPITSTSTDATSTPPFTLTSSLTTITALITTVSPTTPPIASVTSATAPVTSVTPAFTTKSNPTSSTTTVTTPTTSYAPTTAHGSSIETLTPSTVITSTTQKPDLSTTANPTFPWGH